jgi:hypothetical protein
VLENDALAEADRDRPAGLVTSRRPLDRWTEALPRRPGEIKSAVDVTT